MKKQEQEILHSEYQLAIFDWIKNGEGNAIVSAVAGSGKTTTLLDALNFMPEGTKSLFLSFNSAIQDSTRAKITKRDILGVTVSTNHGFGCQLIRGSFDFKIKPIVKTDKYKDICDNLFKEERKAISEKHYRELAKQKKHSGDGPHNKKFRRCFCSAAFFRKVYAVSKFVEYGRMFGLEDVSEIAKAIKYMGKKYDESINLVDIERLYHAATQKGLLDSLQIDFLDMLWIPVQKDMEPKEKFDFIFLDECQDLNAAQIKLVQHTIKKTGARLLAVGDPQQAIYGFAGALPTAWNEARTAFDAKVFPLSVCYRCGYEIVNLAKSIVPQISAYKDANPGRICEIEDFSIQFILRNVKAVLSRFFAPLVHILCVGIPFSDNLRILGLDISQEMKNNLLEIKKGKKSDNEDDKEELILDLRARIQDFFAEKMEKEECDSQVKHLEDVMNSLLFFEQISNHTEDGVLALMAKYLDGKPKKNEIILSTIHKAKGQEWDSVLVLGYNQMPNHFQDSPKWQDEQEENLQYIAITRAKDVLYQHCPKDKFWYKKEFVYSEEAVPVDIKVEIQKPKENNPIAVTKDVYIPSSIINMDKSMVKVSLGTVLEQSTIPTQKQTEPELETHAATMDAEDAENLYQIEREFVLAKGSKSEVPEWARPALKYIITGKRKWDRKR